VCGLPDVARGALCQLLARIEGLGPPLDEAAEHILAGIGMLGVHPDVEPGLRRMREAGLRAATLTNGSATSTRGLLERAGIADLVERTLGVSEAAAGSQQPSPTSMPAAYSASLLAPPC
jgi:2-haloacid dehalogenase